MSKLKLTKIELKELLDRECSILPGGSPWNIIPIYGTSCSMIYSKLHSQAYLFNGNKVMICTTEELGGVKEFLESILNKRV